MWRNLLIQAAYQVTVLLTLNFRGIEILHLQKESDEHAKKVKNTLIFNAFVFAQVKYFFFLIMNNSLPIHT